MAPSTQGSASNETANPPIARWKWGLVWLLFLATMINYMDRQTMGATSPHLKVDFSLSEEGYGWVEFAFQISFAVTQLFAGWVADRVRLRWLYPAALLIWSAAGFFTGLAHWFVVLLICRAVLGFGEAFNWPCALTMVGRILPREAHSLANGIFHSGASIGAAVTPLLVLVLLQPRETSDWELVESIRSYLPSPLQGFVGGYDWRFIFQLVGGLGLLWVVLWFWCVRGSRAGEIEQRPAEATSTFTQTGSSFWSVFQTRRFWIALTISTTVNISWHFYRVWLPRILKVDQEYSDHAMLFVLASFFIAADVGSLLTGYLTRRMTLAGLSVERSRQVAMFGCAFLCLLAVPAAYTRDPQVLIPLILLVAAGAMGGFPNMFALAQEVSPRHTGKIVGINGAVPWFLLAALSPLIGRLADILGKFEPMLVAVAFIPLVGAVIGLWWPRGD